jgi:hypothetical protein
VKRVADHIDVHFGPRELPIDVGMGVAGIAFTSCPFVMPLPNTGCYVILSSWLPPSAPVGMFVTFRRYVPHGKSELAIEIGSVYAVAELRGRPDAAGHTVPVAIGRWLFGEGLLTLHSPDRTDQGDQWARLVGGDLPERDQIGTTSNAVMTGQLAVDRLNREPWPKPPWPPYHST